MKTKLFTICAVTGMALVPSNVTTAAEYGTTTAPDVTIDVTPSNMNGWAVDGYVDGFWPLVAGDPSTYGAISNFTAAPATTDNGAWHHKVVTTPDIGFYELGFDGIAGKKVADWHGFEYRNYQLEDESSHAAVIFEIDQDGDLNTDDIAYARFQPFFLAGGQSGNGQPAANEWNTYGVVGQNTKFLDAVNATTQAQNSYQSIAELFLEVGDKDGTSGGSPVVLADTAVFKRIGITNGLQGWEIEGYVDYLQMTFDTDAGAGVSLEATRYDFGVPEPTSLALLGFAGLGMMARRRRRV